MSLPSDRQGALPARRLHVEAGRGTSRDDVLAIEEPLELRLAGEPIATLMRTPGSDRELALGYFLTEGILGSRSDVGALVLCARGVRGATGEENVVDLIPAAGSSLRPPPPRSQYTTSSCGVCGKRTIEEVLAGTPLAGGNEAAAALPSDGLTLPPTVLAELPLRLRREQRLFEATGALHAAALFDAGGRCLRAAEDIGRHNAVDKVVGWAFLCGLLPLRLSILQVSGRISFEIVQKAYAAGIPVVSAVSGVSSLARDLAERAGITLIGFARGGSFSVYTHPGRLAARPL